MDKPMRMAQRMLVVFSETDCELDTSSVQLMFPNENITDSLLVNLYYYAILDHPKLLLTVMKDISNPNLRDYLLNMKFEKKENRINLLTLAAMAGNVLFVKTLLANFNVNMEIECDVELDELIIHGATALWVAAYIGHLNVVKLLVRNGANVNHNTKSQSSPLRAACYFGHLDIVKYLLKHHSNVNAGNKFNNTSIMIAAARGHKKIVETLLEHGAEVNDQALCGATALHYAAEGDHIDICELLLDHGARLLVNQNNMTPALCAAQFCNEAVVNLFIYRPGLMRIEEIIDAFELLGAAYATDNDSYNIDTSYEYLMQGMKMRYDEPDSVIHKETLIPIEAYDNWIETQNIEDLRAIRLNHHSIHMEALTILERILGKNNPRLADAIIYHGTMMAELGRFQQCELLWNYAMNLRVLNQLPIESDLMRFVQLYSQIIRLENEHVRFSQVLSVLVICQEEIERTKVKMENLATGNSASHITLDRRDDNVIAAISLLKILTKLLCKQRDINQDQVVLLYKTICKLLRNDIRLANGQTLLHLAVNGKTSVNHSYCGRFPCLRTTRLLVHAGASVMVTDSQLNTPLHTLVANLPADNTNGQMQSEKIIKLLIEAGAHIDAVNADNLTAIQLCCTDSLANCLQVYQNERMTLKCLASRCIVNNDVYYKGLIPRVLEPYVRLHSAHKS